MNWKELKNWLDQNIIETDELLVKVKQDKQDRYGNLSTRTLTDFCDSLEATLDNNNTYHLLPEFAEQKSFRELLAWQTTYFGKKTNQVGPSELDYEVLVKLFNDWQEERQLEAAITKSYLSLNEDYLSREFYSQLENLTTEETDMGWLTDDNIEYILKNEKIISQAENIQVRTDIANIYWQLQKTKDGGKIDNDFWNSLNTNKKYILLPLRVSGNHWSLLLFINNEYTREVNWIYYLSSLGQQATNEEIKEISNFLKQIGEKFGSFNNQIINENNLSEMVFRDNPKQPNTWDCGVYICEFIKFLCVGEYYNLNEENCPINSQQIKEFRAKWKSRIGEEKWCKWDTNNWQNNVSQEEEQLNKALTESLLFNKEEQQLQETLFLSSQETNKSSLPEEISPPLKSSKKSPSKSKKINNSDLEKELSSLKDRLFLEEIRNEKLEKELKELNQTQIELEEELAEKDKTVTRLKKERDGAINAQRKAEVLIDNLKTDQERMELENESLREKLRAIWQQNKELKTELVTFRQEWVQTKQNQLNRLLAEMKNKVADEDLVEELLEDHQEFFKTNNSYAEKRLKRTKKRLLKEETLTEPEVEKNLPNSGGTAKNRKARTKNRSRDRNKINIIYGRRK